jgi:hypothetical protein
MVGTLSTDDVSLGDEPSFLIVNCLFFESNVDEGIPNFPAALRYLLCHGGFPEIDGNIRCG